MKVLRLVLPDVRPVQLHPSITVLAGLDLADADRLVAGLRGLVRGSAAAGTNGVVEAGGIVFDATPSTLGALGLPLDVDAVVDAAALRALGGAAVRGAQAGRPVAGRPEALVAREVAEGRVDQEVASARRLLEALDAARLGVAEAAAHRSALAGDASAVAELADADERLGVVGGRLADAAAARSTAAADLQALLDAPPVVDHAIGTGVRAADAAVVAARVALADVADPGPGPVVAALADLERCALAPAPVRRVIDLAERMAQLVDASPSVANGLAPAAVAARDRLARARTELAESRAALSGLQLDPDDVAELEAAHAARAEAEAKVDRALLASPMARRRLVAAEAVERAVLDRIDLPSYGAYLMRTSSMKVDAEVHRRLVGATAELRAAEAEWARQEADLLDAAPPQDAERDEVQELLAEAAPLLGEPSGDLAGAIVALRALRSQPDPDDEVAALASALRRTGSAVPDDTTELRAAAAAWVDDAPRRGASHRSLEASLASAEEALGAALTLASRAEAGRSVLVGDHDRAVAAARAGVERVRLDEAALEAALGAARADVERAALQAPGLDVALHDEAEAARRVGELEAALDAQEEVLRQCHAAAGAARARCEEAGEAPPTDVATGAGIASVDDVEVYLLARLAGLRSVGCVGAAPVVLHDTVSDLPDDHVAAVLAMLGRLAGTLQVVWVTDDDRVRTWALRLGAHRASVLDAA